MSKFVGQNQWDWQESDMPIFRIKDNLHLKKGSPRIYKMIDPYMPEECDQVRATFDKQIPFERETGFVWHKSWNLPELKIQYDDMFQLYGQYNQIQCQLLAVFPTVHQGFFHLHEVGLSGECRKAFNSRNEISFKYNKFEATSFNFNRNKFSLLLHFYGITLHKDPQSLFCLISTPIYVDSRKQARKKIQKPLKSHSYKKFLTPVGRKKNNYNSSEGFISYYGAQNIRNKIKHYFYIAYHFDNVFTLYLNKSFKKPFHKVLDAIKDSSGDSEQQLLILVHEENQAIKKKIISMIQKWHYYHVKIENQKSFLTLKWSPISKQDIKQGYRTHVQLESMAIGEKYKFNEQEQSSENESRKQSEQNPNRKAYQLRTVLDLSKKIIWQ